MVFRRAPHMTIGEVDSQLVSWREQLLTAEGEAEREIAGWEIDWLLELRYSLTEGEAA